GLSTIEPELEDVMKALGAKKWDILVKIGIPRSMPYLFASLKVAITLAYVGSVIAESNASRYGIGHLITRASADFNVPLVFAALTPRRRAESRLADPITMAPAGTALAVTYLARLPPADRPQRVCGQLLCGPEWEEYCMPCTGGNNAPCS